MREDGKKRRNLVKQFFEGQKGLEESDWELEDGLNGGSGKNSTGRRTASLRKGTERQRDLEARKTYMLGSGALGVVR